MIDRHSDYDLFAWVYNRHWQDFGEQALPVIDELVLQELAPGSCILDLCCGAGQLAQELVVRGYLVSGLDGSGEMLRFARENAPGAEFILGDARTFRLPSVYHAVISTFDSLNHIMSLAELTAVFCNVYAALRADGLFLFDLNTEEGYVSFWEGSFGIVEDDHACVVRSSYYPEERRAQFDVTIFRLQDGWQRSDLTLPQRCYSESEVRAALKTAGFIQIRTYGYDIEQGLTALTEEAHRVFFLCRKPAVGGSD